MQGGLGITYFQDTAKDMQMENCSSKSIRTRPDPHPCLNHPHPPPPGRGGGGYITPPHVQSRHGNAADGKTNKQMIRLVTFRAAIALFDRKRTDARSNIRPPPFPSSPLPLIPAVN